MNTKKLHYYTIGVLLLLICFMSSFTWAESLPIQKILPLELSIKAANAAVNKCNNDGYKISVAIVDQAGLIKVQLKADGAGPHTLDSSYRKAYTAASLGESTQKFAVMIAKNPEIKGLAHMNEHILLLGGGFPIKINGEIVGGVGVGGAPGAKLDEACARAALVVLNADKLAEK